ncbi:MAG: hypothetical protein RLZZ153_1478 [Pseudomonadota bacterium]
MNQSGNRPRHHSFRSLCSAMHPIHPKTWLLPAMRPISVRAWCTRNHPACRPRPQQPPGGLPSGLPSGLRGPALPPLPGLRHPMLQHLRELRYPLPQPRRQPRSRRWTRALLRTLSQRAISSLSEQTPGLAAHLAAPPAQRLNQMGVLTAWQAALIATPIAAQAAAEPAAQTAARSLARKYARTSK